MKRFLLLLNCYIFLFPIFSVDEFEYMPEYPVFVRAYPDIEFNSWFDQDLDDWVISLKGDFGYYELIRDNGKFLLKNSDQVSDDYRSFLYRFSKDLRDPAELGEESIGRIGNFGSSDTQRSAPVTNTSFFDIVYNSWSQETLEKEIINFSFFNYLVRIHKKLVPKLKIVEEEVRSLAKTNSEVALFLNNIGSIGGYHWRQVAGTKGKSFHSMGLAVDILPANYGGKSVYWQWERNSGNPNWMTLPLNRRWMPPSVVIDIFEDNGFIWGGKWPIWDNMHFEYRPEILVVRDIFPENFEFNRE